jgi:glucose-6-phosphate 1-dehydrogenase
MGATGDLATRRLIPALYEIIIHKKLSSCLIIGAALEDISSREILAQCKEHIKEFDERAWKVLEERFFYKQLDFKRPDDFNTFAQYVEELEKKYACTPNRLAYMSIAPQFFCPVTEELCRVGLIKRTDVDPSYWYRVAFEKPFGEDRASAEALNACLAKLLDESQIFRIDHYLAKDVIGSIALLRFTNRVLEPLWSHEHIDWGEISLSETSTIRGRGYYYDKFGQLKDVVQNHMLQIAALIAMEAPTYLSGEFIRDEKARVLKRMKPIDALVGQYEGYQQEAGVKADTKTETFAAVKMEIDNKRWKGVPFYFKTGKALEKRETLIHIQFKPVKCLLNTSCPSEPNYLLIRVNPNAGFSLHLNVKNPGLILQATPVAMDFSYEQTFGQVPENSYELLLQELLRGEPSISVRFDEIEYAWDVVDRINHASLPLYSYKPGSNGPEELREFEQKHTMKFRG